MVYDRKRLSKLVYIRTLKYHGQIYTTGQTNTVNNATVNNYKTECSQRLAQLSNNWTTKCPEQTYTIQPTTAHTWTTEYSQQLYTTEQLNT